MRGLLNSVLDLSQKYVDLTEYKKGSCINIEKTVPEVKVSEEEEEEGLSDAKLDQIKISKRRRRRYKNSFVNAKNLVQWSESELNSTNPKNIYSGSTFTYFEQREKQ